MKARWRKERYISGTATDIIVRFTTFTKKNSRQAYSDVYYNILALFVQN